jgi:hypothetical protein
LLIEQQADSPGAPESMGGSIHDAAVTPDRSPSSASGQPGPVPELGDLSGRPRRARDVIAGHVLAHGVTPSEP